MPWMPPHPCRWPGCTALVPAGAGGYCPEHERQRERERDARRGSSTARGYGRAWRRQSGGVEVGIRERQLAREPYCRLCMAEGKVVDATEVDHIVPKALGGTDGPANLQSLCKTHHSAKSLEEMRARHPRARRPRTGRRPRRRHFHRAR